MLRGVFEDKEKVSQAPKESYKAARSLEAEQSALGACLIDKAAISRCREMGLMPGDFSRQMHSRIYTAILNMDERGWPVDIVTFAEAMRRYGREEELGGIAYVACLIEACPSSENVGSYVAIIKELARLRSLASLGEYLLESVSDCDALSENVIEDVKEKLSRIEEGLSFVYKPVRGNKQQ